MSSNPGRGEMAQVCIVTRHSWIDPGYVYPCNVCSSHGGITLLDLRSEKLCGFSPSDPRKNLGEDRLAEV